MTHPLEKYLQQNGLTKAEFAGSIQTSRVTIHRIISGGKLSLKMAGKINDETGISSDELRKFVVEDA